MNFSVFESNQLVLYLSSTVDWHDPPDVRRQGQPDRISRPDGGPGLRSDGTESSKSGGLVAEPTHLGPLDGFVDELQDELP